MSQELFFIVGARPNFVKIAPIFKALHKNPKFKTFLVHTGQHYDPILSDGLFKDLGLPSPNVNLGVGSGSHAFQTGMIMSQLEPVLQKRKPWMVIVVGDVNSTLAGALTACKLHIPVAHIEAGLRSRDFQMPEEINRMITDSISDYLFTHCEEANQNLFKEGVSKERVFFVGNVMVDTLLSLLPKALKIPPLSQKSYGLITLHRPSNVDHLKTLENLIKTFKRISKDIPLFFPVHPRTQKQISTFKSLSLGKNFHLLPPLSYLEFLSAMAQASLVLTDSGGIQEETTILHVPCLTLRENTERMITAKEGTNHIVGTNPRKIYGMFKKVFSKPQKTKKPPKFWDGKTSQRIIEKLENI